MPNNNPVGVHQPFDQRPIPARERFIIGGDQLLINGIPDATDVLAVTIPTDSNVVREVGNISLVSTVATAGTVTVQLVYIDGSGNEAVIGSATIAAAINSQATISLEAPFFVTSEDTSVVIRSASTEAEDVHAVCQWNDIRGLERTVVPLVSATAVDVLPSSIKEGEAVGIVHGTPEQEEGAQSCWLLNYDSLTHGTFAVSVTEEDGTSARLRTASPSAPTGEGAVFFTSQQPTGFHQTGGNIAVTDSSTFGTGIPVIMTATFRTNLGEIAPDQASAF